MRFAQLGLMVGSFTSWQENANGQQSQWLEHLIQWTLHLPDVSIENECYHPQLGIPTDGFLLIYYTLLQARKRQALFSEQDEAEAKQVKEALIRLGISLSTLQQIEEPQTPYDRYNYPRFKPLFPHFQQYVTRGLCNVKTARPCFAQGPRRRSYIWLDDKSKEDSSLWVKAIKDTLNDLKKERFTLYDVMRFGEKFDCCVFAPLDISKRLPCQIYGWPLTAKMQGELADQIEEVYKAVHRMCGAQKAPRYLYLSWDLLAFDYWRDDESEELLYRTMLALWTNWPRDTVWAPPGGPSEDFSSPSFSSEEATSLFTDVLAHVRRYFMKIKDAYQFSLTEQKFVTEHGSQTCYPPTFYFADPIPRLPTNTAYIEDADIPYLLSQCLGYDDPHASTLSWSTLEGSMVTVRGEVVQIDYYKPRYLLLPILAESQSDEEIGADLDTIVDVLSAREYTIALEAVKINNKIQGIVDMSTAKTLDFIVHKLARVLPGLSSEERENCIEEFVPLQLALGRVQSALEKTKRDASELDQQYHAFIERTETFLGRSIIMAPVHNLPSLLFIGAPTIKENDFHASLMRADFHADQANALRSWLDQPENSQWIKDNSVERIATALKEAGVTASPPSNNVSNWQKNQRLSTFLPAEVTKV